jgi:hypothetical protein
VLDNGKAELLVRVDELGSVLAVPREGDQTECFPVSGRE